MEPRPFTEAEKQMINFFFYVKEMHDNYVKVLCKRKEYVIAPIGDSFDYACTSEDELFTEHSFSKIKDRLDAGNSL
jgi:hypothetical protein|nr:MAG TPA: hypothetical protein [Caudoviricetes sp.]